MREPVLVHRQAHPAGTLPLPSPKTPPGPTPPGPSPDRRELRKSSIELPAYVWDQVRTYLDGHPDMRVRNMVMAGFQSLGLQIDPEDLVAERKRGPGG